MAAQTVVMGGIFLLLELAHIVIVVELKELVQEVTIGRLLQMVMILVYYTLIADRYQQDRVCEAMHCL